MTGETDLIRMLTALDPELWPGEYVFCSMKKARYGGYSELTPIAAFKEGEGLTLVIPKEEAEAQGIPFNAIFRCITLKVHSSLEAVGLTAAVSKALAQAGISANMMAGYYHDHIFVLEARAQEAKEVLIHLARSARDLEK